MHFVTGVAVDVAAFKSLPPHYFKILGNYPEFTSFLRAIIDVIDVIPTQDKIQIICDDEEQMGVPFFKLYRQVKREWPDARERLTAITFADDRFVLGLQAADLVASLMRQEANKRFFGARYEYEPLFEALSARPDAQTEHILDLRIAFAGSEQLMGIANDLKKK